MLFLGHYDIKQVEIFTSSITKMELIVGHSYFYEVDIFTLAHH